MSVSSAWQWELERVRIAGEAYSCAIARETQTHDVYLQDSAVAERWREAWRAREAARENLVAALQTALGLLE